MRAQLPARLAIRDALFWHILLILAVSGSYELLFVHHGIGWLYDEGWPLYAAMQLHEGGVLYEDVFFLFPPGQLLPAWIAYALDPPGVILARSIYAGFTVAACVAVYLLGRKLMRPGFALLAALLVAVAAPRSHLVHVLFVFDNDCHDGLLSVFPKGRQLAHKGSVSPLWEGCCETVGRSSRRQKRARTRQFERFDLSPSLILGLIRSRTFASNIFPNIFLRL